MRTPTPGHIGAGFVAWFVFCALVSLAMLGLIAWAIVTLVNHFA
jgi:hypothetical protein